MQTGTIHKARNRIHKSFNDHGLLLEAVWAMTRALLDAFLLIPLRGWHIGHEIIISLWFDSVGKSHLYSQLKTDLAF